MANYGLPFAIKRSCVILSFFLVLIALQACDGDPLLIDLTSSNTSLVLKGTYESNDPRPWWGGASPSPDTLRDDSATNVQAGKLPGKFLIDLGEIKINSQMFTTKRIYHYADITDGDPFFSGKGVSFSSEDLSPGSSYSKFEIYFRKLLFDEATEYDEDWGSPEPIETQFGDTKIEGYNFVPRMEFVDAEAEDDEDYVLNPLYVYTGVAAKYVLRKEFVYELRVLVKNYVKFYELNNPDDEQYYSHYGFGDVLNDVTATGDTDDDYHMGGNVVSAFYWYIKDETVVISGNAPANRMVVAIPESCDIADYTKTDKLPDLATWCSDGTYTLENVRAGESFKLYYSNSTPNASAAELPDGFTGETIVEIAAEDAGTELSVDLN